MQRLELSQVALIVGGVLRGEDREVRRIVTDTRDCGESDLFVAIRGERFDPHDFLDKAASASAAIVERVPENAPPSLPMVVVDSARIALADLARHHRRSLVQTKVVSIAGSNGKTGTKHLLHAALSQTLRGTTSPKSFNNDIGVPLTLLPVDPNDDYVVVEVGTNHPGEVEPLSKIALPDVAIITSIGEEHLEGLGDLDGVRRENATIVAGMDADGVLILPGDEPRLRELCDFGDQVITFGTGEACDYRATDVRTGYDGTRFRINGKPASVPALGLHAATNAAAAFAAAVAIGVDPADALRGLASAEMPAMRMQILDLPSGIRLINDAYNANPASMRAALATLRDLDHAGRKVAVLGTMLELGGESERYHRETGREAVGVDLLIGVGSGGKVAVEAAISNGLSAANTHHFDDAAAAAAVARSLLREGDLVLLKASRGVGLERIAETLTE